VLAASRVLGDMEFHGVSIDQDYIPVLEKGLTDVITKAHGELELMAPGVNHNSGPALAKLLYEDGWQPLDGGPRVAAVKCLALTKKGARSTAAAALAPYLKYDEQYVPGQEKPLKVPQRESMLLHQLFLYKKALKARDTFLTNLRVLSRRDGKMHASFHIPGTGTGRLSCVHPDTRVETEHGDMPISHIVPGTRVRTHTGALQEAQRAFPKGTQEMYRVTLSSGETFMGTADHFVLTDCGWQSIADLMREMSHVDQHTEH